VAGGGIAGLTAAFRLTQAGSEVTIVEPNLIGGKLQTSMFAGRAIDEAADAFLLRVPWALGLCHDLDIDGELISPVARTAHVFVDGRRHPMPAGHVMGVPTDLAALERSGLLSRAGLARVARDLELPAEEAGGVAGEGDDIAVGPYLRRRLGDEVVDHLIGPLIGGINAGDIDALSMASVVPQLFAAVRSGDPSLIRSCRAQLAGAAANRPAGGDPPPVFATPLGGMARLVDALMALMPGADVRLGRRVESVEPSTTTPVGSGRDRSAPLTVMLDDASSVETDAVVLACPAFATAPLIAPFAPLAAGRLASLEHASVSMLTVGLARGDVVGDLDASGCLVPSDQGTLVTAVSYGTSKWAQWRDPERDDIVLRVSAGRIGDHRHLELDDADLTDAILADLDRIVGVRSSPEAVRVRRWPRSLPQYAPGHRVLVGEVARDLDRSGLSIALAGAAYEGVGVPACIRSGEVAAASLGATWPTRREITRG